MEQGFMSALNDPIKKTAILDKCVGCKNATEGESIESQFCKVYTSPAWKWEMGQCNFATHIKREAKKGAFINPLKLAKMRARGLH